MIEKETTRNHYLERINIVRDSINIDPPTKERLPI